MNDVHAIDEAEEERLRAALFVAQASLEKCELLSSAQEAVHKSLEESGELVSNLFASLWFVLAASIGLFAYLASSDPVFALIMSVAGASIIFVAVKRVYERSSCPVGRSLMRGAVVYESFNRLAAKRLEYQEFLAEELKQSLLRYISAVTGHTQDTLHEWELGEHERTIISANWPVDAVASVEIVVFPDRYSFGGHIGKETLPSTASFTMLFADMARIRRDQVTKRYGAVLPQHDGLDQLRGLPSSTDKGQSDL